MFDNEDVYHVRVHSGNFEIKSEDTRGISASWTRTPTIKVQRNRMYLFVQESGSKPLAFSNISFSEDAVVQSRFIHGVRYFLNDEVISLAQINAKLENGLTVEDSAVTLWKVQVNTPDVMYYFDATATESDQIRGGKVLVVSERSEEAGGGAIVLPTAEPFTSSPEGRFRIGRHSKDPGHHSA